MTCQRLRSVSASKVTSTPTPTNARVVSTLGGDIAPPLLRALKNPIKFSNIIKTRATHTVGKSYWELGEVELLEELVVLPQ